MTLPFRRWLIPIEVWSMIAFLMLFALSELKAGEYGSVTVMLQWIDMASIMALLNEGHVLACFRLTVSSLR